MLTFTAPGDRQHFLPNGRPCRCTPAGGVDLAQWNGRAVDRWNDLHRALARKWGVERFEYFKAVEVQKRGALHLHVLVRVGRPVKVTESSVRRLAIRHGYGHEVDVAPIENESAAWYVAKYVTKASAERDAVPYVHRLTGEVGPGRWRTWSASRRWGASMASVLGDQVTWARENARGDSGPVPEATAGGAGGALDPNGFDYAEPPTMSGLTAV